MANGSDGECSYVSMVIGNQTFWSLYHPNIELDIALNRIQSDDLLYHYYNRELLQLVYKLIELSPAPVGGEYNPLRTPRDLINFEEVIYS